MSKSCKELSTDCWSTLIKNIDTFVFDCDGVLWNEHAEAMENAVQTLDTLKQMGKKIFLISNNSTKTRREYADRARKLGFHVDEEDIICTAWLAAAYLKDVIHFSGKIYLIGGAAIATELTNKGIDFIGYGVEEYIDKYADYLNIELDPEVNGVVVGFDPYINFVKTLKASSYLQRPECLFVATNTDSYLPASGPIRVPGTGSLVQFVAYAAEKTPIVVGKPNTLARDVLMKTNNFDPQRTIMVGDRLDTDMLFGNNCGFKTLLVLTGVASLQDVNSLQNSHSPECQKSLPDYYLKSVGDLLTMM